MSTIDRQRIAAVKAMESMGYRFVAGEWKSPHVVAGSLLDEADAMHALLVLHADKLEGCTEGSSEAQELDMIAETIEAYEAKRWSEGKIPGGKG